MVEGHTSPHLVPVGPTAPDHVAHKIEARHSNGHIKHSLHDNEAGSDLGEPDSNIHSPSGVRSNGPKAFIVAKYKTNGDQKSSHLRNISGEDGAMTDLRHEPVAEEEPYTIKCICNSSDDDGNTIYCETCDTWQHIECFYPENKEEAIRADFSHSCADCQPRALNRQKTFERSIDIIPRIILSDHVQSNI